MSEGSEVWSLSPWENGVVIKREEGADMFRARVEFAVPLGQPGGDVLWAIKWRLPKSGALLTSGAPCPLF